MHQSTHCILIIIKSESYIHVYILANKNLINKNWMCTKLVTVKVLIYTTYKVSLKPCKIPHMNGKNIKPLVG